MGDIMRLAKINTSGVINKRNFSLLANPALRLAYPQHRVYTTKINGHEDVYKRQPGNSGLANVFQTAHREITPLRLLSRKHQDVYKRQGVGGKDIFTGLGIVMRENSFTNKNLLVYAVGAPGRVGICLLPRNSHNGIITVGRMPAVSYTHLKATFEKAISDVLKVEKPIVV